MLRKSASFRFYAELNEFLPTEKQKKIFSYKFAGTPSVKDAIEAIGVPHTEVDLILVNGRSVDFRYRLKPEDRVSVYPVFESLDISPILRLRKRPLRKPMFVLDVHLGKLARFLRLAGFDTRYQNDFKDPDLVRISVKEKRILLTRDRNLLKNKVLSHALWIRSTEPQKQLGEVLKRLDLKNRVKPFRICLKCNGRIAMVPKSKIASKLLPKTKETYRRFYQCHSCKQVYWKGTHYDRLKRLLRYFVSRNAKLKIE